MRVRAFTHVLRALVLGALLLTAAACGEHPAAPGLSPSQPAPAPSSNSGPPTSLGLPQTMNPSQSPAVTVSGVIIEGLRPTCRVLDTGTQRYALVGPGTSALHEGDRVTVTGSEQPGTHNPCGTTFVVTQLRTTAGG